MIYIIQLDYFEEIEEVIKSVDKYEALKYLLSIGCPDMFSEEFFDMNGIYLHNEYGVIDMDFDTSSLDMINKNYYMNIYDKALPFIRDIKLKNLGI